jgi:hypothetical protein
LQNVIFKRNVHIGLREESSTIIGRFRGKTSSFQKSVFASGRAEDGGFEFP